MYCFNFIRYLFFTVVLIYNFDCDREAFKSVDSTKEIYLETDFYKDDYSLDTSDNIEVVPVVCTKKTSNRAKEIKAREEATRQKARAALFDILCPVIDESKSSIWHNDKNAITKLIVNYYKYGYGVKKGQLMILKLKNSIGIARQNVNENIITSLIDNKKIEKEKNILKIGAFSYPNLGPYADNFNISDNVNWETRYYNLRLVDELEIDLDTYN